MAQRCRWKIARRKACGAAPSRVRTAISVLGILAIGAMLLPSQPAVAYVRPVEYRWPSQAIRLHAQRHPERTQVYLLSCVSFLTAKLIQPALVACNHAVDSAPRSALALKLRGSIFLVEGELERARVDFSLAIASRPTDSEAHDLRGRALAALDRYPEALADLDEAVRLDPRNTDALEDRGSVHQLARNFDAAIGDFTASISIDPHDAMAWNGRCWVRMLANKDIAAALADCHRALKLAPGRDDILDSLGWVYLRLGRMQLAIGDFDAALARTPTLASSLFGRGVARLRVGAVRAGWADIKLAKDIQPGIAARFRSYGIVPVARPPLPVPKSRPTTEQAS